MSLLLSTAYFPPLDYFAAMASQATLAGEISPASVILEAHEHYCKQSWRNRCSILTASGKENLMIPIQHTPPLLSTSAVAGGPISAGGPTSAGLSAAPAGCPTSAGLSAAPDGCPTSAGGRHIPIREVRIDYSTDWLRIHKTAISSAYGHSAFFEHYRDDIFAVLDAKETFLFDLNLKLLRFILSALHLPVEISFSEEYVSSEVPNVCGADFVWDLRAGLSPKKPALYRCESPYYQVFADRYSFVDNLSILDLLFNEGPDALPILARMKRV